MRLREIEITNFRNLRNARVELPSEGSFLVGKNGQGKTNFLEAIYYLGTMRSFRTKKESEIIRFGKSYFRVEGLVEKGNEEEGIEAGYDGKRKKVKIGGVQVERIRDAFGALKVVIVTPEDVEIVVSSPSKRRRFVDIVLSMISNPYRDELTDYHHVLRQRNALLRGREVDGGSVSAWDEQMAVLAGRIARRRKSFVEEFEGHYRRAHRAIDEQEECSIAYLTSPRRAGEAIERGEDPVSAYRETLAKTVVRDRELGATSTGPHRDDISFELGGKSLKNYGSQGQVRTAVFSLKVAEAEFIEEKTEERPVVLMDDVLSQLDRERGTRLMEMMSGRFQIVMTTPRKSDASRVPEDMKKWWVERGVLSAL